MRHALWVRGLVAIALLSVAGCPRECKTGLSAAKVATKIHDALIDRGAEPERNRYIAVSTGKKSSGGARGITPYLVRIPFDVSVRVGVFDPAFLPTADEAEGCLEFKSDDLVSDFYTVCAVYGASPKGMTVYTEPTTTSQFYADAERIEIRGDTLGASLLLSTRAPGETLWTELGDFPLPASERGFRIGAQAAFVPPASELGFDDLVFQTTEPSSPTAEEAAATSVEGAVTAALEALALLDGRSPDLAGAQTALANAGTGLSDAQTILAAVDTKDAKKAAAKLKGAAKQIAKAQQRAGEGKADAAVKLVGKAGTPVYDALDLLLGS